ncbi:succinate dehydrogenase, hydrophobic membrane anchor protein [Acidihalobacter ferrooxydans]|uniref:Succinate dehydrogenase hydrophobic membrane anchor subunit n=1 Tax=Acidihalobacter ferrooxydans TaxID=1765967 RepID=A0A1P8UFQ5_9GAMM|nr:succinate dehydrogenase, hydrophobic membrane anchor protein [Acidihalobacter ferrooxydans]APZ42676.1 succinate dehydrogenase, hydrophobic membrane anchor protein [Acidihalobacter ferrooxydans]
MSSGLTGLRAWIVQRISAAYLGAFFVFAIGAMAFHPHMSYAHWRAWLGNPVLLLATGVFVVLLLLHAWIGVRDILIDYVHPLWLRVTAYGLVMIFLLGCGLWAARILLQASGL